MQQSTKKKIAKEIIILFVSVAAIGVTWAIFWGINEARNNKLSNLRQEISSLSRNIDSIKLTFPKAKDFVDIIVDEIPDEKKYIPTYEGVMGSSAEKNRIQNIRKLYSLLVSTKFSFIDYGQDRIPPFLKTKTIENGVVVEKPLFEVTNDDGLPIYNPHFKIFVDSIEREITIDTINLDALASSMPHLRKIFDFLIKKKKLTVNIQEFVLTLNGMPLPPPESVWTFYQNNVKTKENLSTKLESVNSKIYTTSDWTNIDKWICIVVLLIVYPLRLLYYLLLWAIKTLRQN